MKMLVSAILASALAAVSPARFLPLPLHIGTSRSCGIACAGTTIGAPPVHSDCGISGTPSCTNSTAISNLCCFEYPRGLILLTQSWQSNTGPTESWTIYGLWSDNCDGTYITNCDPSRDYSNISGLLENQGASSALLFMQTYWVDRNGDNEKFWEHEWAAHGTCYSTLHPGCLSSGSPPGAEAVAFFQTVVSLYQQYDIYNALEVAGITPSLNTTYLLSDVNNAIQTTFGVTPVFQCSSGRLNQVQIYFNLQGSIIDGQFNPIDAPSRSKFPSTVHYLPKA